MKTKSNEEITKKGTVLLKEKPFAYVLKSKLQGERCDFCFQRSNLMRCSGCKFVHYCNRDCQREGWSDHAAECKGFKKVAPRIVPDAARLMGRIICKLKKGGDMEKGQITYTRVRRFKDLMSHYSDLKQDKQRLEHFESLVAVLAAYLGPDILPNEVELLGIFGRICVNSFNILDPEMASIGSGIYLACTIIDHSCTPNAVAVFEGTTIYIRATQDFKLDWNKVVPDVRISYIELLASTSERQKELQNRYYFLCDCAKCLDVEGERKTLRALACTVESCRGAIPIPDKGEEMATLSCPDCGHAVKTSQVLAYQEEAQISQLEVEKMRDITYLDVCRQCLKRHGSMFHPLDLIHVKILDAAFESAILLQQWEEAQSYGTTLVPAYIHFYGTMHPLLGILHLKLTKLNNLLENSNEARKNLHEAEKIIKITHGQQSTLYKEQIVPLLNEI